MGGDSHMMISKVEVPWSEKYRPKSLDEVSSHKDIIDTSTLFCCCWMRVRETVFSLNLKSTGGGVKWQYITLMVYIVQ